MKHLTEKELKLLKDNPSVLAWILIAIVLLFAFTIFLQQFYS
jgi:hypothetical protein